jgi:hypothetical protein
MKIYIYQWNGLKRINSTKDLIVIEVLFKKWKKLYRYLNCIFLPQKPNRFNWFCRLFKNIEVVFHDQEFFEKYTLCIINRGWARLIREI